MAKNPEKQRLFISKVHLKGFKSIQDLTIDFNSGLNILIGKNGSGKSNFLECLNRVLRHRLESNISFRFSLVEFRDTNHKVFSWKTEESPLPIDFRDDLEDNTIRSQETFYVDGVEVFNNFSEDERESEVTNQGIKISRIGVQGYIRRLGYNTIIPLYIKFNIPENIECVSLPAIIKIQINEFGMDLWPNHETLGFIQELFWDVESNYMTDIEKIQQITKRSFHKLLNINSKIKENLVSYSPIQDIRFNENVNIYKEDKSITIENIKIDFKIHGSWIPWSQLSDGTKRLIYIITEITNKKSGFVFLEEPELGIHPHQFHLLMQFLKEQSEHKQIILSTHSPQALNSLSKSELSNILITYYDSKNGTQMKHLTNAQTKKAIKYMDEVGFLSDYWMLSDMES